MPSMKSLDGTNDMLQLVSVCVFGRVLYYWIRRGRRKVMRFFVCMSVCGLWPGGSR